MIDTNTFLLYCFYGMMFVSGGHCLMVIFEEIMAMGSKEMKEPQSHPNRFLLAGILFCLAAIGAKMWGGFPV